MVPTQAVRNDFWRDRRVLVTGATGLVGSYLCGLLYREGADIVTVVRDELRNTQLVPTTVDCVRGDICDLSLMRRVLGEYEVDTVFHLAAQTIVSIANRDPWSTWESNVRGTYTLMEAVRLSSRVRRVVVASTDKVYGQSDVLPTTEDQPLLAQYPYEVSKACADMVCRSYHSTFHTPVVLTRCGNLFGSGDLNWNRLVPGTVRSAFKGEPPVIRSDGSLKRDYIYVGDVADAYLALAEAPRFVDGHAFNISDGVYLDVLQMTREVLDACGRSDLEPIVMGQPVKEIPEQYLDSTKIRSFTGWSPRYGFREGLQTTVKEYRAAWEYGTP